MISSEVQRTLVKSPPELWAELSDPAALARHLGELGEIRITRTEPEKLVEWEAEGTKGTVAIKASGWGTKVTLSVSRELPAPEASETEPADSEAEPIVASELGAESGAPVEPSSPSPIAGLDVWAGQEAEQADQPTITAAERFAHDDPEPLLGTRLASEHEAEDLEPDDEDSADIGAGPEPLAESPEPAEPRRGFLARLFGRRRGRAEPVEATGATEATPAPEPSSPAQAGREVLEAPDPAPAAEEPLQPEAEGSEAAPVGHGIPVASDVVAEQSSPEPVVSEQSSPELVADIGAELKHAEETASEEVTAVLTGMLDRLGAAHHRPFSRA